MVPGETREERQKLLEADFAAADTDGNGTVDYAEFVYFYSVARKRAHSSEMRSWRNKAHKGKQARKRRAMEFIIAEPVIEAVRAGRLCFGTAGT